MEKDLKLTGEQVALLRCPACGSRLTMCSDDRFECMDEKCDRCYPIVDSVPILINENNSVFRFSDFLSRRQTFFKEHRPIAEFLRRLIPSTTKNLRARQNYASLAKLLLTETPHPRVLVIGGSILGAGMEALGSNPAIELIDTDVSFGPRAVLICDAHDLPFGAEEFDAVVSQAVLEHVVDPARCVAEFHRVLRPRGVVFAETPFMQQVHAGAPDFTRFTHLGHRRLFRMFDEIDSGVTCGPGMALAWSWQYFLMSFARGKMARHALQALGRIMSFWLLFFDPYLAKKSGGVDAASAVYFLGRKAQVPLCDRELLKLYRGAI